MRIVTRFHLSVKCQWKQYALLMLRAAPNRLLESMLSCMPLCRLPVRHSYVIFAGNPKQIPCVRPGNRMCQPTSSRGASLAPASDRLETWRPLPSHNSNSFALLWSEYMSNSKLVTSVVFLSRELKLPRLPRVSQGYVLLTTLITQWTKQPAK